MPENLITHPVAAAWTPARIREKILTSDVMLERSLLKIYEQQTTSEQNIGATVEHNKVGFTAFDAEFMTSLADQIRRNNRLAEGHRLTISQRAVARNRMLKYAKQLSRYAKQPECEDCNGTGNALDQVHTCARCHGRG